MSAVYNAVSAANSTDSSKKSSSSGGTSSLNKDAFLKLLCAQMSNQDPLSPSTDTEYISQLAQFSMLEQMQNLNSNAITSQSYNLIGKYVYIEDSTSDTSSGSDPVAIYGRVDGVIKQKGVDYVIVGGKQYKLSDVTGVLDGSSDTLTDDQILQSANLIGKTVTASITDSNKNTTTVTGQVTKITIKDGMLYATVNGQQIQLSDITEINA